MKIAIHGKKVTEETYTYVQKVFSRINESDHDLLVTDEFINNNPDISLDLTAYGIITKENNSLPDAILSLGGDGTLLEALLYASVYEIPIMGINTGRLGFLATTSKQDLDYALDCLFAGDYKLDRRMMLRLTSDSGLFQGFNYALNEFAIIKRDTSSMINIKCYINGEFLNSYWADGLMVSTPTGSTGYSLSCGGPIMFPNQENFIITPISPHNLNVRPLIVSSDSDVSFRIESRNRSFLVSMDSRSVAVGDDVKLSLRKETFKANLITLANYSFADTLRKKLNWGLDLRN